MKALRYYGARDIRHEAMDDPRPHSDRDAIVRMTGCSICGSDLHIWHGHGFSEDIGFCVGHEAVGEVVEVGRGVSRLKVGDSVMVPAAVGCGACRSCLAGVVHTCENNASGCYGLSAALQGVQAEAFRVPAADVNAVKIPDGVSQDQALMMTDALATAWFGARQADIRPGSGVAVIGLGPIGLMAVDSAFVARAWSTRSIPCRNAGYWPSRPGRSRWLPRMRSRRSARRRAAASSIAWSKRWGARRRSISRCG
jgi:threonine dehydrogenase-like Zn-dependent dehydrogenase